MKPITISYLITMGDSLSDRGTFYQRYLFGFIPVKMLSNSPKESPVGRYTNGFVWSDHISAMIANEFIIRELKDEYHMDSADIADGIIDKSSRVKRALNHAYKLDNDQSVTFKGKNLVRNYNEAGLSAHDYGLMISKSPSLSLYRNLVSTLSGMRQKLLAYDEANDLSEKQKSQTLILEWSGANDLIFVNERPSKASSDRAVQARIENLKQLIQHGYRHFVLFNLPDLALTPRYQNMSENERENAHECSAYFNAQLAASCKEVAGSHLDCSIDEFDVFETFTQGYQDPAKYGFDAKKIKTPYINSIDFKLEKSKINLISSAKGYMFYDDLHPIAYLHALIGERVYNKLRQKFNFCAPNSREKNPAPPHENKTSNTVKLMVGGIATAAAIIGLRKVSSMLGISAQTTAIGLGLATLGFFAKKPVENYITRANELPAVMKECKVGS